MPVDKYMAKWDMAGISPCPTRNRDGMIVSPTLMMEVHEKEDGTVAAYAIPPPTRLEDDVGIIDMDLPATSLQEAGNNVLAKRNMELQVENDALKAINRKLEEQNRELMERLMRYADKALEVLHGQELAPSGGRRSSEKKPRASKGAGNSQGAETSG
jgi:hypothetical protein